MRTQVVRRLVVPEMLALSMVELILTFTLALISLTPSLTSPTAAAVHSALMCALTVCFIAFVIGLYRPQIFERARSLLFSTFLSALFSFPAVWIVSKGLGLGGYWPVGYDPFRPVKIIVIWCVGVLGIRLLFLTATRMNLFLHRVAVVGPVESPSVVAAIRAGRRGFLEVTAVAPEEAMATSLGDHGFRTLVVTEAAMVHVTLPDIQRFETQGIKVQSEAEFWERSLRRVDTTSLGDAFSLRLQQQKTGRFFDTVTRTFDLVVSLTLLIATLPIICIVAVIVRLDSPGPVLYRQERVGLNSRPFTLLKFRSMRLDAEASGPRWAQQKDPRVTRVGLFMRKTRIDELPQLINILVGEMSFIGPRPERPHFVHQLSALIPSYEERARVKPGLTGWAQVNYPYGASVEDARAKLSYDLYYVKNRTFLLDLLILLSTVRVILLQEGAR